MTLYSLVLSRTQVDKDPRAEPSVRQAARGCTVSTLLCCGIICGSFAATAMTENGQSGLPRLSCLVLFLLFFFPVLVRESAGCIIITITPTPRTVSFQ